MTKKIFNKKRVYNQVVSHILLFSLIQTFSFSSFAQPLICSDIYSSHLSITTTPTTSISKPATTVTAPDFLTTGQLYGLYLKESDTKIETLLRMVGNALFTGASPKDTLEKGELRLAVPLKDGYSLEGEYQGSDRIGGKSFHLIRLHLILPNGQEVNLDKTPLSVDNKQFLSKSYSWKVKTQVIDGENVATEAAPVPITDVQTWATAKSTEEKSIDNKPLKLAGKDPISFLQQNMTSMSDVELQNMKETLAQRIFTGALPKVIQGEDYKIFERWIERLEELEHSDLRNHADNLWTLRGKYIKGWFVNGLRKRSSKEIFKAALYLSLAYLITNYDKIKNYFTPAENQIDILSGSVATSKEADSFLQFLNQLHTDPVEMKKLWALISKRINDKKEFPLDQFNEHVDLMSLLFKYEFDKGQGNAHIELYESPSTTTSDGDDYIIRTMKKPVNIARTVLQLPENIVVTEFESARIITVTYVEQRAGLERIRTLVIKQSQFPKIFSVLSAIPATLAMPTK